MRDWNKDGKRDIYDRMIDYKIYKEVFEKEEEQEQPRKGPINVPPISKEYSWDEDGVDEFQQELRKLVRKQKQLQRMIDLVPMKNLELEKNFWLVTFADQFHYNYLTDNQKIALLQTLLEIFQVEGTVSASEYYSVSGQSLMKKRYHDKDEFYKRMRDAEEEYDDVDGFCLEYKMFVIDLTHYMKGRFYGFYFGEKIEESE